MTSILIYTLIKILKNINNKRIQLTRIFCIPDQVVYRYIDTFLPYHSDKKSIRAEIQLILYVFVEINIILL